MSKHTKTSVAASKEMAQKVVDLRAEGMSFKQAGQALGITKDAAIGLVHHKPGAVEHLPPPVPLRKYPFDEVGQHDCRWPIGHPGALDFSFCAEPIAAGGPYCGRHRAVAFQRVAPAGDAA